MEKPESKGHYDTPSISVEKALDIIRCALDISARMNVRASVSVVDRSMRLVAFAKADGATPHSTETSRRKADTAASTGRVTGWMLPDLAIALPLASGNRLTNIPGGFPLAFEGKLAGGLGISGGTTCQDAEIAARTIQKIGLAGA